MTARARTFVDTNVLVYAVDASEADKQRAAQALLSDAHPKELVISAQVLNEFYVTVTRKLRSPLAADAATRAVESLSKLEVIPVTAALVLAGIDRSQVSQLSLWDALVVEAARSGGCTRLLTEDLSSGQDFDGVLVVDPFAID